MDNQYSWDNADDLLEGLKEIAYSDDITSPYYKDPHPSQSIDEIINDYLDESDIDELDRLSPYEILFQIFTSYSPNWLQSQIGTLSKDEVQSYIQTNLKKYEGAK